MPTKDHAQRKKHTLSAYQTREEQSIEHEQPAALPAQKARTAPHLLASADVLQLQRAIGNRAVNRLLASKGSEERKASPHVLEDCRGQADTPIQRSIVQEPPQIALNRNIAHAWKGGGDYAVTPSIINGKRIPPTINKNGMILAPFLYRRNDQRWGTKAAEQHVGWGMELPVQGPWQHPNTNLSLEELDAFAGLHVKQPPRTREQLEKTYTLEIRGDPDDGSLWLAIQQHEFHHVEEQADVIDDVLRPWDTSVENNQAVADDPLFAGLAYDNLHLPKHQAIADQIVSELERKGKEYHDTDTGKEPITTRVVIENIHATHGRYIVYLKPRNL